MPRYIVKLSRPVYESLTLEINAPNEDTAADKANAQAEDSTEWESTGEPGEFEIDDIEEIAP